MAPSDSLTLNLRSRLDLISKSRLQIRLCKCFSSLVMLLTFDIVLEWLHLANCKLNGLKKNLSKLKLLCLVVITPHPFLKTVGGIVLGSVAVSADVLLHILVAIKSSFLKFDMCNICKNNIAKMFLVVF